MMWILVHAQRVLKSIKRSVKVLKAASGSSRIPSKCTASHSTLQHTHVCPSHPLQEIFWISNYNWIIIYIGPKLMIFMHVGRVSLVDPQTGVHQPLWQFTNLKYSMFVLNQIARVIHGERGNQCTSHSSNLEAQKKCATQRFSL